jgi:2-methylisocitrate lyase-like PEP mutase family enzyme
MLKTLLQQPGTLLVPGAYDALSALLVEQAGFPAVFLSGASLSYARLGRPDCGLITATELAETCARMADRIGIPVLVDADSGFGNAVNLQRTVRLLDRAGAAAVQIEDQVTLKPLQALQSRPLVPVAEMVGRIKAAQDARLSSNLLISARTDVQPSISLSESMDRASAYIDAGCDLMLAEGLSNPDDATSFAKAFGRKVPLIHNLLEGGPSPFRRAEELAPLGFKIALFAGAAVQTMARSTTAMLADLLANGTTAAFHDRMFKAPDMARLVGAPELVENAKRWDG